MNNKAKKITTVAMLSAMAFIAVALCRIPVVLFLKYEPKDVIITIGGFLFGPLYSLAISFIVSFVEMITISSDGIIGFIMNFISSALFAGTAAFIYKKKRTIGGAICGLTVGAVLMTILMLLWNYIITPIYMETDREVVAQMLIPVFLPFNVIKGVLNVAITMLIYKPVVNALRKAHIIDSAEAEKGHVKRIYVIAGGISAIIICVLAICILNGVIKL